MSGVKRRSQYRKNVTQDVLYNFPEPTENQCIGQILRSLGSNLLAIQYINTDKNCMEEGIARLPTKFRKLVWVKRGDYIIASVADGDIETSAGVEGKVKYTVEHILYTDQIKHLQKQNLWPQQFAITNDTNKSNNSNNDSQLIPLSSSSTATTTTTFMNIQNIEENSNDCTNDEDNDSSDDSSDNSSDNNKTKKGNSRKPMIQFGRPGELPPSYSDEEYEE